MITEVAHLEESFTTIKDDAKDNSPVTFSLHKEEDIDWRIQNQIHRVLNQGFEGISTSFVAKTYGYERPHERILGWENGKLVCHAAIKQDSMWIDDKKMKIGFIGLLSSISQTKGMAKKILQLSIDRLRDQGLNLSLAITKNPTLINYIVPKFCGQIKLVDIPIHGKEHTSKPDTLTMLFNLDMTNREFSDLENSLIKQGHVNIQGEPF